MKIEEYLKTVTEQIRCVKARDMVGSELEAHILDQAAAYEADGMQREDALEQAVRDMGDPVETGISLDRVHRPQMSVDVLALIGVISILSILFQGFLMGSSEELAASGYEYLKSVVMYNVYGYLAMLLIYRLDYSILARYGKWLAAAVLAFLIIGRYMGGTWLNGMLYYIWFPPYRYNIRISVHALLYLYIPLYASVLYSYRGQGYKAVGKIFLWSVIPLLYTFRMPAMHLVITLGVCFAVVFSFAVWKNWYRVNRKRVLLVLGAGILAAPMSVPLLVYTRALAEYQIARLQAFLEGGEYNNITNVLREFLKGSRLIGSNGEAVSSLTQRLPGFNSDYVLVSLISSYGILAGILVILLLALLIGKIFRISVCQKNQLGMVLGISCGTLFLVQLLLSLAVNMCLIPVMTATLPFFSSGGNLLVVSYMLLGLVLSIYRYKNILPPYPRTAAAITNDKNVCRLP